MGKRTPLYDEHLRLGGKIVEYAGWDMPVEYDKTGLTQEHEAVRSAAGIFDVSHMGEILIQGKDAEKFVDYLVTNDTTKLNVGQIFYTFFCNEKGGVVDDLLVYRLEEQKFLLVVNAANTAKDWTWVKHHQDSFDVHTKDLSPRIGQVAIQGPMAEGIVQKLTKTDLSKIKPFHLQDSVDIAGVASLISRTGYTGEDGFEIYCDSDQVETLWKALLEAGKGILQPAGLGCRDTLRFEAALPLYGNELNDERTPLESGFKFFVKLDKGSDFIGKEALIKQEKEGVPRRISGIELEGRGIPRQGYEIFIGDRKVGEITTGYLSPTLKKPIANALLDEDVRKIGNEVEVQIRKRRVPAQIISKYFLKKWKENN